ncbi:transcriptional regulator with XRE-family HTH domain [Kitasatospora sp. MAP12-15]|uniref:Scr1 family TA system antitoxin-like transcriptional regulator n=1 Tax=unclassified Kitasatospora TaxID=2633591 RepID=UPI0024733A63|nr:Scr1 family TA system antitoxin-like transcriptional regulator [Kitasatospora sp. MAP12-44]MDH6113728.1 transcriptional regulator with XRE-family HTH domain [Kitasatospora sp. MAP12-44]
MPEREKETISAVNAEALGAELRRIRGRRTLHEVGRGAKVDPGNLSKIERGKRVVAEKELTRLLDYFGTGGTEREDLMSLLTEGRVEVWWTPYKHLITPALAGRLTVEANATLQEELTHDTFGLVLQRRSYAREIIESGWSAPGADDVELYLDIREARQRRMLDGRLRVHSIFSQAALDSSADHEIMADQLEHLLKLPDTVTLQMVPTSAGRPGRPGAACVDRLSFDTPDAPQYVFSEGLSQRNAREFAIESIRFNRVFKRIRNLALTHADTAAVLKTRLKEIS